MDPVLIFFAALAGFLCYQLYTKLGSHDQDDPIQGPQFKLKEINTIEPTQQTVEQPPPPDWAKPIVKNDPDFDPQRFIDGAQKAYEMIVNAFAMGNLYEVKPYIDPSVYRAFETAIDARKAARQNSELQFVGIETTSVEDSFTDKGYLKIVVRFLSNQIRVLRDEQGNVVEGDPARIDLVQDLWTFARPARSQDPNWTLVATGATPSH
ncbi:MAG: Tim44/TimA family putative adaptor protein [bacterium]